MEPENKKNPREKSRKSHLDEVNYDSAFKKYIPTQQFGRPQDFLAQYPLLYYPNQLMCAAAQYAALQQQQQNSSLTQLSNFAIQSYPQIKRVSGESVEKVATSPTAGTVGGSSKRKMSENEKKNQVDANGKQKTFACPECGKIFNAHYNLTRHMPVHTGARPFICKVSFNGFLRNF